jgi:DNA-directed RNA polymerase sigma subunit (sigma70/sigma32)
MRLKKKRTMYGDYHMSYDQIASILGLTREEVRRIERSALKKIRVCGSLHRYVGAKEG